MKFFCGICEGSGTVLEYYYTFPADFGPMVSVKTGNERHCPGCGGEGHSVLSKKKEKEWKLNH